MTGLSTASQISLYTLLALIGILTLVIWWVQVGVLSGKPFPNPDGSADDWHDQKIFFGIALADVFVACPTSLAGLILVFWAPKWGFYVLALIGFWLLWTNTMTTATSLRFEKPRITLSWIVVFPLGALIGLAYIVWTLVHFDVIFLM